MTPLLDVAHVPLVWLAGAVLLLAWLGVGLVRIRVLARRSEIVRDRSWHDLLALVARDLGIGRPVTLLRSRVRAMPMTWGVLRPIVLLPAEADAWPADRRRDVLLHELAHVGRWDVLTQLIASLACAVYWFHPLVWVAARRLRVERERACDDQVIRHGRRPSDYAGSLLEIARAYSTAPAISLAGVAMARRSQLADRLLDVLDAGRDRDGVGPRVAAPVWAAAAMIVLPLAVLAPERPAPVPEPRGIGAGSAARAASADRGPATESPKGPRKSFRAARGPEPDTLRGCTDGGKSRGSSTNIHDDDGVRRTTVRVTVGRCEVVLKADAKFTFTADFTDIATVSPGGEVVVETDDGEHERRLTVGRQRVYLVDRVARPFDAEARAWLAETLTFLLRRSGFQAQERAQAILERRGIAGLIDEIALLDGDYARRRYYQAAVASGKLDPAGWERLVARAGSEIASDYELAELLVDVARRQALTDGLRAGFVAAAGTLGSDYERRRVLDAALTQPGLSAETATAMLRIAAEMASDYELAELLIKIQRARPIGEAQRAAFFTAAGTIGSDYERRRVLGAVVSQADFDRGTADHVLRSARDIASDYELAELLVAVARRVRIDDALRPAFDAAANTIQSSYESDRVMAALARSQTRAPEP